MTEEPQLQPLPDGVLDKLRQVSTSTIATQLYKRGFRQPQLLGVRPISQVTDGFVAEAFTMRFIPAREDVNTLDPYRSGNTLQWDAIESVPPGHVIVVDSRGDTRAASGGDMLMPARGNAAPPASSRTGACVTGTCCPSCRSPPTPARSPSPPAPRGTTSPTSRCRSAAPGWPSTPVTSLVADRDGIIVIPRSLAAEIADPALEQEKLEAYVALKIQAGEPLWGNYPPGEQDHC
jgi:Demethylmenaquinone methyltransferase